VGTLARTGTTRHPSYVAQSPSWLVGAGKKHQAENRVARKQPQIIFTQARNESNMGNNKLQGIHRLVFTSCILLYRLYAGGVVNIISISMKPTGYYRIAIR
jgi:hypothetical protein